MHVVVVGAGPGGLFAAETLSGHGHDVIVVDQRRSPARKFVLAGRGGLNITHSEPIDQFLDRYGPERSYLEDAIRSFTPDDLRAWVAGLGEESFVGSSGRVFPQSFRAVPLLRAWLRRLDELGVGFEFGHTWLGWSDDGAELRFESLDGSERRVECEALILALGGASWPRVGADGSWVDVLTQQGIRVEPLQSANCGVRIDWSDVMVTGFAGVPIKNAAVVVGGLAVRGDPVVTRDGLEGGPIYAHSRAIRERLGADGSVTIEIDLFPDLDLGDLVRRLVERRQKKKSLSTWLRRSGFSAVAIALLREVTGNDVPSDPDRLAELAKAVPVVVEDLSPIDRAISSAGGVAWSEVDEHFQLRDKPGTYVVGEMLDWEAPTGGYLLQAVFSTAHAAAIHLGASPRRGN